MPKLKIDRFCSLATSPSWQNWLFQFNQNVYRDFIKQLQSSHGCGHNQQIMTEVLKVVDGEELIDFLRKNHPHVLVEDKAKPIGSGIFENYNPSILTYPRRLIIVGGDLQRKVDAFIADKVKSDYVIVDDKAFIEYLTINDAHLIDLIPVKNWSIDKWRLRQR